MAEVKNTSSQRPAGILPDRAQPHNHKIEQAVLAAMLREPKSCVDIVISLIGSSPENFYSAAHRDIFSAAIELNAAGTAPDLLSVAQKLRSAGKLDAIGGEVYLAELFSAIATTVNIEAWCQILLNLSMLRRMINACSGALVKCYDNDAEPVKLVEEIETDIYNIRNVGQPDVIKDLKLLIKEEFQALMDIRNKKVEVGIPTGFAQVDEFTGGLKPGEMFVLAARPSIGKTSLALNVLRNVALNGTRPRPVAFFSLEMTAGQIARRLLCTESKIPESVFRNHAFQDRDLVRLTTAVSRIKESKIFVDPTGGITIAELRAKARRLKMQHNIELIVIDYLQLCCCREGQRQGRQIEVSMISQQIKAMAKELKIPVIVLSQLSRANEQRGDKYEKPKLSDLRDSGAIEQDADVVFLLRRPSRNSNDPESGDQTLAIIDVAKNRNGETGEVRVNFFREFTRFEDREIESENRENETTSEPPPDHPEYYEDPMM